MTEYNLKENTVKIQGKILWPISGIWIEEHSGLSHKAIVFDDGWILTDMGFGGISFACTEEFSNKVGDTIDVIYQENSVFPVGTMPVLKEIQRRPGEQMHQSSEWDKIWGGNSPQAQ